MDALIESRREGPPSIRELNPAVTPAIEAIVLKLLAPEPKDRYQTADDLRTDIDRHLADRPLLFAREKSTREQLGKWRRRNPGVPGASSRHRSSAWCWVWERSLTSGTKPPRRPKRLPACGPREPSPIGPGSISFCPTTPRHRRAASRERRNCSQAMDCPTTVTGRRGPRCAGFPKAIARHSRRSRRTNSAAGAGEVARGRAEIGRRVHRGGKGGAEIQSRCPRLLPARRRARTRSIVRPRKSRSPPERRCLRWPKSSASQPRAELFLDAAVALSAGNYAVARPLFERVVKEQPNHGAGQFCLAYSKEQLGQHESALERYDMAESLLPKDARPACRRGVIFGLRQNTRKPRWSSRRRSTSSRTTCSRAQPRLRPVPVGEVQGG